MAEIDWNRELKIVGGNAHYGKKFHKCTVCGKLDHWGKTWSWYGSYRDLDDGVPVRKYCSQKCIKNDAP